MLISSPRSACHKFKGLIGKVLLLHFVSIPPWQKKICLDGALDSQETENDQ